MEMILTGSSTEVSLYFAGGPTSGCTMPVMNDLSHGPGQNLAKTWEEYKIEKERTGMGFLLGVVGKIK
jgi:hypothetical protein